MSLTVESREVDVAHYYPNTVAPSKEFKTLAEIENTEFNTFWARLWRLMANTFVYDIDTLGASRWEEMLNIKPAKNATLYARRQTILAKINATLPYTERKFQQMLNAQYGTNNVVASLDLGKYEIWLDLNPNFIFRNAEIRQYTHAVIPANLVTMISMTESVIGDGLKYGAIFRTATRLEINAKTPTAIHLDNLNEYRGAITYPRKRFTINM